ncbi:hypothetical protein B296_00024126 [Ensete ventricosum]|uniref:Uncharacterized protein n=1 Tax=Ensete ventricosum TaxID=4639 RepID=A0A427ADB6_ENSVE|nr:hypothetical protein B296_00024126 [Ensete ventricosum]
MLIKITKLAVPKDWICSLDETAIKRAKCSQKICSGAEMGKHACNWGSVVLRIRGGGEQDKTEGGIGRTRNIAPGFGRRGCSAVL